MSLSPRVAVVVVSGNRADEAMACRPSLPDTTYRNGGSLCRLAGARVSSHAQEKLDVGQAMLAGVADYRSRRFGNRGRWKRESGPGDAS